MQNDGAAFQLQNASYILLLPSLSFSDGHFLYAWLTFQMSI